MYQLELQLNKLFTDNIIVHFLSLDKIPGLVKRTVKQKLPSKY